MLVFFLSFADVYVLNTHVQMWLREKDEKRKRDASVTTNFQISLQELFDDVNSVIYTQENAY